MVWIEDKNRILSLSVVALGIGIWLLYKVLASTKWSKYFFPIFAETVGALNLLYQMIVGPLASIGLIICSAYLLYMELKRVKSDIPSMVLCAVGIALPALFIGYMFIGFFLLATMDF